MKKYNNKEKESVLKIKTLGEIIDQASSSVLFKHAYIEEFTRLQLAIEIKNLRLLKQKTQTELAELADMPQSVIARIESGKHSISLATLSRIASALGGEVHLTSQYSGTMIHKESSKIQIIESPYFTHNAHSSIDNSFIGNGFEKNEKQ